MPYKALYVSYILSYIGLENLISSLRIQEVCLKSTSRLDNFITLTKFEKLQLITFKKNQTFPTIILKCYLFLKPLSFALLCHVDWFVATVSWISFFSQTIVEKLGLLTVLLHVRKFSVFPLEKILESLSVFFEKGFYEWKCFDRAWAFFVLSLWYKFLILIVCCFLAFSYAIKLRFGCFLLESSHLPN